MTLLHKTAFILYGQNFIIHLDFGSVFKIVVRYMQVFLNLEILKSESLLRGGIFGPSVMKLIKESSSILCWEIYAH